MHTHAYTLTCTHTRTHTHTHTHTYTHIHTYTHTHTHMCVQSEEFEVYSTYTENYLDAVTTLEELLSDPDVVQYFRVSHLSDCT